MEVMEGQRGNHVGCVQLLLRSRLPIARAVVLKRRNGELRVGGGDGLRGCVCGRAALRWSEGFIARSRVWELRGRGVGGAMMHR